MSTLRCGYRCNRTSLHSAGLSLQSCTHFALYTAHRSALLWENAEEHCADLERWDKTIAPEARATQSSTESDAVAEELFMLIMHKSASARYSLYMFIVYLQSSKASYYLCHSRERTSN